MIDGAYDGADHGGSDGHSGHGDLDGGCLRNIHRAAATDVDYLSARVVHKGSHGKVNLMAAFEAFAKDLELVPLSGRRALCEPVSEVVEELVAWNHFNRLALDDSMPQCYLPGFSGRTTYWRQHWQIGKRHGLFHSPEFDKSSHTQLIISCVTWEVHDTGEFETKFVVLVQTHPAFMPGFGYAIKSNEQERNNRVADQLCQMIYHLLTEAVPEEASVTLRQVARHHRNISEEVVLHPDGVFIASAEEEQAISLAEAQKAKEADMHGSSNADLGEDGTIELEIPDVEPVSFELALPVD